MNDNKIINNMKMKKSVNFVLNENVCLEMFINKN